MEDASNMPYHLLEEMTKSFSLTLGSGHNGRVYLGVRQNGEPIAVKVLHCMLAHHDQQFRNRAEKLLRIKHQNIVEFLGFCSESRSKFVWYKGFVEWTFKALCMEYVDNGSLDKHLSDEYGGLEWHTRYKIIKGICEGLKYLHEGLEYPFYHMDLIPANILLNKKWVPKLASFGSSISFQGLAPPHRIKRVGYSPPEYLEKGFYVPRELDIFYLGVVIIKIMTGPDYFSTFEMLPQDFVDVVVCNWRNRLQRQPSRFASLEACCQQVKTCLEVALSCAEHDRHRRPSIGDIIHKLNEIDIMTDDVPSFSSELGPFIDQFKVDDGPSLSSSICFRPPSEMVDQKSELEDLERILGDVSAEPTKLSYTVLQSITNNFCKVIGHGGFAVVYQGLLPNGRKVAVKKLFQPLDSSDELFVHEINCLRKAKHSNVVRLLGYCAATMMEFNGSSVMADKLKRLLCFEYVPNGSLHRYLKGKAHEDEWQIRYQMIKGICQGLHYLHETRINHLDLKPENILLDVNMEPKITDFGMSRCFEEGHTTIFTETIRGTRGYIAPEIINNREISLKSDIFSLGIIIIKLLIGRNKYDTEKWHESLNMDCPRVRCCTEIAQACLDDDQHKRPTIGEIMHKLIELDTTIHKGHKESSIWEMFFYLLSERKKIQ